MAMTLLPPASRGSAAATATTSNPHTPAPGSRTAHAPTRALQPRMRACGVCHATAAHLAQLVGCSPQAAEASLRAHPALAQCPDAVLTGNHTFLAGTLQPRAVERLLSRRPQLLSATAPASLEAWWSFCSGYGMDGEAITRLFALSPEALLASSPFRAGLVVRWLRERLGMDNSEIAGRILGVYPGVLSTSPDDLDQMVGWLRARDFDDDAIRSLLMQFPMLLRGLGDPHNADTCVIIERIRAGCKNKYVVSGSYWT